MSDVQNIEIDIEKAEKEVNKANALDRLHKNKDFQEVILDGYFKEESSRLVRSRADVNFTPDNLAASLRLIDGIAGLLSYFNTTYQVAMIADRSLRDAEKELELANIEEVANGR